MNTGTLIQSDLPYTIEAYAAMCAVFGSEERMHILHAIHQGKSVDCSYVSSTLNITNAQEHLDALERANILWKEDGRYLLKPTMPVEAARLLYIIFGS